MAGLSLRPNIILYQLGLIKVNTLALKCNSFKPNGPIFETGIPIDFL